MAQNEKKMQKVREISRGRVSGSGGKSSFLIVLYNDLLVQLAHHVTKLENLPHGLCIEAPGFSQGIFSLRMTLTHFELIPLNLHLRLPSNMEHLRVSYIPTRRGTKITQVWPTLISCSHTLLTSDSHFALIQFSDSHLIALILEVSQDCVIEWRSLIYPCYSQSLPWLGGPMKCRNERLQGKSAWSI